ncbi:hypothetical protein SISSUDRAFT_1124416 [Sistotremastrum suecicum HHB10207 ss-3]|uniref:NUDE domain-containing protein n=1 Tax=Sistotremastrum suecicum HHB10207 ss-3 TaxID=1314776 RepID=A0A166IGM3_9AGAM|nr:hypothetical protein SISSUDRAFT_1124416 [Sistotremastrum suecicum HHB10207 ss-3]
MTAVLQAGDAFGHDQRTLGDAQRSYAQSGPPTDWEARYNEIHEILSETRRELEDFQQSSRELEDELERELERTETEKENLRKKVLKAETECNEWKSKFMNLQTTSNTTTTSLQRELDTLRQDFQKIKIHSRELEMGNDDLERNERAVASSLADAENRYSKVLEEKILLEHELLDKAGLEEQSQRLRDELRDANAEISILKEQIKIAREAIPPTPPPKMSTSASAPVQNLLVPPRTDMSLADLAIPITDPEKFIESAASDTPSKPTRPINGQTALLQRAGFPSAGSPSQLTPPGTISGLARSSTLPSLTSAATRTSSLPQRNPIPNLVPPTRTLFPGKGSNSSSIGISTSKSSSRGVQMVSEMRARVKNLEMKIHTRVPRLRMGSMSKSVAPSASRTRTASPGEPPVRRSVSPTKSRLSVDDARRDSNSQSNRTSIDSRKGAESPGWVLIMEESQETPIKVSANGRADATKKQRRTSSPMNAPSAYRSLNLHTGYDEEIPTTEEPEIASRPASRLSASKIRPPSGRPSFGSTSRPETPTFLPVPSSGRRSSLGLSTNSPVPKPASQGDDLNKLRRQSGDHLAAGVRRRSGEVLPSNARRRSGPSGGEAQVAAGPRKSGASDLPTIPSSRSLEPSSSTEDIQPVSHPSVGKSLTPIPPISNGLDKSRIGRSANRTSAGNSNGYLAVSTAKPRDRSRNRSNSATANPGSRGL